MGCCDNKNTDNKNSKCCPPTTNSCSPTHDAREQVREQVREGYAKIAQTGNLRRATTPQDAQGCDGDGGGSSGGGCCGKSTMSAEELARTIGYSAEQIRDLPEGANMGLSCGNPTAIAGLSPGQTVLDLGSGGGFDVFLAGPKVGATGRVIGVDMTPEMLTKARRNIAAYRQRTGLDNVEFRLGEIEHLPLADASVDVVISNCVINLSPDKLQVWQEIARVLRPGGRVAVSDLALLKPLPAQVTQMVEALVGCVAGAILLDDYRSIISSAGLVDISLRSKPEYVSALAFAQDPLYQRITQELPAGTSVADFITSIDATAAKA
ncbi:MAG: arsenite methyltransferase [Phycisphaerae bacterium]|nr:arsenite methyltransferase [Phycisphaerae bacterium]